METGYTKYYIRPEKILSEKYKEDKAAVLIDFSYQKENRKYVSNAYINFTLHYATNAYIMKAAFILEENKSIDLPNIQTLDRNVTGKYIRVGLHNSKAGLCRKVLESIKQCSGIPEITLENGETKRFIITDAPTEKIEEAFNK